MTLPSSEFDNSNHSFYGLQDAILSVAYLVIDIPKFLNIFFRLQTDELGSLFQEAAQNIAKPIVFTFVAGAYCKSAFDDTQSKFEEMGIFNYAKQLRSFLSSSDND